MTLLCSKDSSSILRDAGRPTVNGNTVPGKMTMFLNGRMGRTSGICCCCGSSSFRATPMIGGVGSGRCVSSEARASMGVGSAAIFFYSLGMRLKRKVDPNQAVALLGLDLASIHFFWQVHLALELAIVNFHRHDQELMVVLARWLRRFAP